MKSMIFAFMILKLLYKTQADIEYKTVNWFENGVDGLRKDYHACQFDNAVIENSSETINTKSNKKTNDEVLMVLYWRGNEVKVIPATLFSIFPNLEYFYINNDQKFKTLQPQFFHNAKHLKVIRIYANLIAELTANVLVGAPNLEHINLQFNKIEIIHVLAFNSLLKLKGIYLAGNKIKVLHSRTFSYLPSLERLDLIKNDCVDKNFTIESQNYFEVEEEIAESCSYDLRLEDVMNLKPKDPIVDLKLNEIVSNLLKMEKTIEKRFQDTKSHFDIMENYNTMSMKNLSSTVEQKSKNDLENVNKRLDEKDIWSQDKFDNLTRTIQIASNSQMHHLNSSIGFINQEMHIIASNLESTKKLIINYIELNSKNIYMMIDENEKAIKELKERLRDSEDSSKMRFENCTRSD